MKGRTVRRFTLSRTFVCVPAKRQHNVMMKAMKAVTAGKRPLRSIMAGQFDAGTDAEVRS